MSELKFIANSSFKLDADNNPSKELGAEYSLHYTDPVTKSHQLIIKHFALPNKIISCLLVRESAVKLEIRYSPSENDFISFENIYWRIKNDSVVGLKILLEHPANNIYYNLFTNSSLTSAQGDVEVSLSYNDAQSNRLRYVSLFGKLDIVEPMIQLKLSGNGNKLSLDGSVLSKGNHRGFGIQAGINEKDKFSLITDVDMNNSSIGLVIGLEKSRAYKMHVHMPCGHDFTAKVVHNLLEEVIEDSSLTIHLNNARTIWGKLTYQQGSLTRFQQELVSQYTEMQYVVNGIWKSITDLCDDDFARKMKSMMSNIQKTTSQILKLSLDEVPLLARDIGQMTNLVSTMYDVNDFYMKDFHNHLNTLMSYKTGKISCALKTIFQAVESIYKTIEITFVHLRDTMKIDLSMANGIFSDIKTLASSLHNCVTGLLSEVRMLDSNVHNVFKTALHSTEERFLQIEKSISHFMEGTDNMSRAVVQEMLNLAGITLETFQFYVGHVETLLGYFLNSIADIFTTVYFSIMDMEEANQVAQIVESCVGWFQAFHFRHVLLQMDVILTEIVENAEQDFYKNFGEYMPYINDVTESVNYHQSFLSNTFIACYAKGTANILYQKMRWMWNYVDGTTYISQYLMRMVDNIEKPLNYLTGFLGGDDGKLQNYYNVDFANGLALEFRQNLPMDWNRLDEWPRFEQLYQLGDGDGFTQTSTIDKYRYEISSIAANFVSGSWSIESLLPPFTANGLIAGHHIVTFDNTYYVFVGTNCSYILAKDFLHDKFTIIINYNQLQEQKVSKTLRILSQGYSIDISDQDVSVGGEKIEMPFEVGQSVTIVRVGARIKVMSRHGFSVECNLFYDICTFQLSGWYFGKTGGLLGTYNNEKVDDLSSPSGQIMSSIRQFADTWRIGNSSKCHSGTHFVSSNVDLPKDSRENCKDFFHKHSSPFASCFTLVNPEVFYSICRYDEVRGSLRQNNRLAYQDTRGCTSFAAYISQCNQLGLSLWMPPMCVECKVDDGGTLANSEPRSLALSERLTLLGGAKSADVVFVVEQANCILGLHLAELISKLNKAFGQAGINGNRFAVVAFGGRSFHEPHIKTVNGQIWAEHGRGIEKAFDSGLYRPSNGATCREHPPSYPALKYAASLSFRGGASKTVVLVQCDSCADHAGFAEATAMFAVGDISLHILQPRAVLGVGKAAKVYGADLSGAYTGRNLKTLVPNEALLKQVTMPKDLCTSIALETNGTVFNLERLSSNSSKKFLDVWSRRLAAGADPTPCQVCDCAQTKDGVPYVNCQKCLLTPAKQTSVQDWNDQEMDEYIDYSDTSATASDYFSQDGWTI